MSIDALSAIKWAMVLIIVGTEDQLTQVLFQIETEEIHQEVHETGAGVQKII